MNETLKFSRRNLPHWLVANKSYFVTLRLHGTLPKSVLDEFAELKGLHSQCLTDEEVLQLQRRKFKYIERYLDCNSTENYLDNTDVADMVFQNLQWFSSKGWVIHASTILSTHIHLLMSNTEGKTVNLLNDLSLFKRYTGRKANVILNRIGDFWAREDFDHWIRTNSKFENTVKYIAMNPVKANRVKDWKEWRWTFVEESLVDCIN